MLSNGTVLTGCMVVLMGLAGPASAQDPPFHFPSVNPNANIGEQLDSDYYFDVQLEGTLARSETINILTHHRSRFNLPYQLSQQMATISKLLVPGASNINWMSRNDVVGLWRKDLEEASKGWKEAFSGDDNLGLLLTDEIREALVSAPNILQCGYMLNAENPHVDPSSWKETNASASLYFWANAVPPALQPDALRLPDRRFGVRSEVHPFIVIGPPASQCPPTFGEALAIMAPQLPAPIPAMDPAFPQQVAEETGWGTAAEGNGPNLSYLPRNQARYFTRILAGDDERSGGKASSRLGLYLAFHRAFATTCQAEMNNRWLEYMITRESERLDLLEVESIWLDSAQFDEFYLAASSLVPVIILEFEEDPFQDFGSRDPNQAIPEIYAIQARQDQENQAGFAKLLDQEGCDSEIAKAFRVAVSNNLPQMQAEKGESAVSMFYHSAEGARSLTFMLDSPYDPDSMSATGMVSSSDAGLFPLGSDYGGRMLSYLALGDFSAARSEQRKSADEVIRQIRSMGPPGYNPLAEFYEWGFRTKDTLGPYNALITSYIIRRVQVLGACGDPLVPVTRSYVEIETRRTVSGIELGSREVGSYTDRALVPVDFRHIVDREEDVTPGQYSRSLVDGAIGRLTCDSEMRRHLEANMIAFNSGEEPAWVNPESKQTFGANTGNEQVAVGESAYVYTDAQAAVKFIEEAAQEADPRFSMQYPLVDADDRSAGGLNLLRIDGVPAIAFNTRYIGEKPGSMRTGRTVGLIMTCAGSGNLEISQFLMSSEPNDLDQDASYNLVYRAYGLDGQWTLPVRLESELDGGGEFTFARFRGQMVANERTFAGLRLTSNFQSYIVMGPGKYPLDWSVEGGRVNTTLAPLIDHCRSTGS